MSKTEDHLTYLVLLDMEQIQSNFTTYFLKKVFMHPFVFSLSTATLLVGFLSEGKLMWKSLITGSPLRSSLTSRMRTETQIK